MEERRTRAKREGRAHYLLPYRRTRIMNEGWATYRHEQIMQRLSHEVIDDFGLYLEHGQRVRRSHPDGMTGQ